MMIIKVPFYLTYLTANNMVSGSRPPTTEVSVTGNQDQDVVKEVNEAKSRHVTKERNRLLFPLRLLISFSS